MPGTRLCNACGCIDGYRGLPKKKYEDCDLGGIRYSELFSKLSVESYTLEIP